MSWANNYIEKLQKGEEVKFRPSGNSMTGKINNKELITVVPITIDNIEIGDIALCKVKGNVLVHLVTAKDGKRVQISNNHGHVNGWTKIVYGKVIKVET